VDWCGHNHTHHMVEYDLEVSTEHGTFGSSFYLWYLCSEASFSLDEVYKIFY